MSSNALIHQLINSFQDPQGSIDLIKINDYMKENRDIQENCHIFKRKLQTALSRNQVRMTRSEFQKYFSPDLSNKQHYDLVFSTIDTDDTDFISKRELQLLNKKYDLRISPEQLKLMIQFTSEDGQKISRAELYNFIK